MEESLYPYQVEVNNDSKFTEKKKLRDSLEQSKAFQDSFKATFMAEVNFHPTKSTIDVEEVEKSDQTLEDLPLIGLVLLDILFTVQSDPKSNGLKVCNFLKEGICPKSIRKGSEKILRKIKSNSLSTEAKQRINSYIQKVHDSTKSTQASSPSFTLVLFQWLSCDFVKLELAFIEVEATIKGSKLMSELAGSLDDSMLSLPDFSSIKSSTETNDLNDSILGGDFPIIGNF